MTAELPPSPYKGLAPFGDTDIDAMLFFGREQDVEIVCANVVASRLTVLYGPSGVGKTSLLGAAVARSLRALPEQPVVLVFAAWSELDDAALAEALAHEAGVEAGSLAETVERACVARGDVYLLLDQADEYFLYHPEQGPLETDLASVLRGYARANVLISLREDALAKLDRFKAPVPEILDNYLRLERLSREEGRAAVERPLERWRDLSGDRVEIEPELTERVLDEVAAGRIRAGLGGAGQVAHDQREDTVEAPYLQLVLERIWEVERSRDSDTLRLATLEELGGAEQIVAAHLESAMDALTPPQQRVASALLRQLVTPSGAKIAHAAPDLAGYAGVPEGEARGVLDALAARRILRPGDDGRYEIYHDVLAAPILAWRARYEHAEELVEAHRRNRRLGVIAGIALAGLVVMGLVAVFALVQRSNASDEARAAHARELDASALSVMPTDPELALVLARDSALLSPTQTAEDVLRQALFNSRLRRVVVVGQPLLDAVVVGRTVITATADGGVLRADGRMRRTVSTGVKARDASESRGGIALLTGVDGRLRLVSGGRVSVVPGVRDALGASISAGGSRAAVRFAVPGEHHAAADVRLVDLRGGRVLQTVRHKGPVTATAVSDDGMLIATGGEDRVVRVWDARTGKRLHALPGHVGPVAALAFSSDGTLLGSASTDGQARIWDVADGKAVSILSGHGNFLEDIGFSPDGRLVVTASRDRTAKTSKTDTGALQMTYAGATEAVASGSFTPSGLEIVTASEDGVARVWDAIVDPELPLVANLGAPVTALAFVQGGSELAATAGDRAYQIAVPHGPVDDVGPAPAVPTEVTGPTGDRARVVGKTVSIAHTDGTTVILRGHKDRVTSVAFSSDGSRVVTASWDHDARVWDAVTGAPLQVLRAHFSVVSDARYSPDGRWIVTAGPGTAGLWNAATGAFMSYFRGHEGRLLSVAFAPDSRRFATGGADGTVRYYRCAVCGGVDDLVALADERLAATGRVPTEAERRRFRL